MRRGILEAYIAGVAARVSAERHSLSGPDQEALVISVKDRINGIIDSSEPTTLLDGFIAMINVAIAKAVAADEADLGASIAHVREQIDILVGLGSGLQQALCSER